MTMSYDYDSSSGLSQGLGGDLCMRGVLKLKLHVNQGPFIVWLQWPPLSPLHFVLPASSVQWMNKLSPFFKHTLPLHYPSPCTWHYSCYLDPSAFFLPVTSPSSPSNISPIYSFLTSATVSHSLHWLYLKNIVTMY